MSKLFFRWLRGELNGYYITNLHDVLNSAVEETRRFFVDFKKMQLDEDMPDSVLFNIGKFASVFLPRKSTPEKNNSVLMTDSFIRDGVQYSERGLYETLLEKFRFFHTYEPQTVSDINMLADDILRSSLVGDEAVAGYIASSNTNVFDEEGNLNPSAILSSPPVGEAYSEYYGDKFLFLSEGEVIGESSREDILLSESFLVNDIQYSERGLLDVATKEFSYKYDYAFPELVDINSFATPTMRSSLVGTEEVEGYIASSNLDVFDEEGNVKPSAILSSPPVGEAYSEFYGEKFLFLSEGETYSYSDISPSLYLQLYKVLQWIRYNGNSLASLLKVVELICPDSLVLIDRIEVAQRKNHYLVYYNYNVETEIEDKEQRVWLFEYLVGLKFKQYSLVQNPLEQN